ncbi:hypothetical protein CAPTEDRAFT_223946 [Capitella teleta]|uniref:carbonyl reductase (NADPH) n=1 Tax=Capitella teleta TaxID=283909 RepID=R7UVH8_CAPTE|nr:hypothetical protein CAPTEDRAFT_223946 [Capitella teleta]|eukprot:ELU10252.1 hypothetical protein CAPTEDRAFT_223946 [Capitella teleta]
MARVAVVTGSNKGIGLAIARGLCKQFEGDVILTARDKGRGQAAVAALAQEGLKPKFHQLDVQSTDSVQRLTEYLHQQYDGVDVLVNNAGVAFMPGTPDPEKVHSGITFGTNYFGLLSVSQSIMPILRPGARVVNVSTTLCGTALTKTKPEVKDRLLDCTTIEETTEMMREFLSLDNEGTAVSKGWHPWAYVVSKLGVSILTPMLQYQVNGDININAVCPGFVKSDMTQNKGVKTPEQGAETPLFAALLPPFTEHPKGEFISEKKVLDWVNFNPYAPRPRKKGE